MNTAGDHLRIVLFLLGAALLALGLLFLPGYLTRALFPPFPWGGYGGMCLCLVGGVSLTGYAIGGRQ
jgi:hypothetical protein